MFLRTCKSPALLTLLAAVGAGLHAQHARADGPRDYEGPTGFDRDGQALEQPTAPPPGEASPADAPVEEAPVEAPPAEPEAPATPPPAKEEEEEGGCAEDDGFCVEDLTSDKEALKKEMAPKQQVKVAGPAGKLAGRVLDASSGSPLIGVKVSVVGTDYKTKTDIDGNYELSVPPGTYQVKIAYDAYEGMTISGVAVAKDETQTVSRELKPIAGMTQTVVVKAEINKESAAGKLVERKKSASARDVMSRDDIRKSGGGSASAVARRIVGTTVVGDRFIFVRGLGHRYGNTLLDGARLPSPDPNLRTVPLDIIPSGALAAINVQKTATPDVPADFAGASVQLETRETPDKFYFALDARVGANTATTFRQANAGNHFQGDNFTFGNLQRDLPASFDTSRPIRPTEIDTKTGEQIYSPAQLERFGESLPSTQTAVGTKTAPPNFGAGLQLGNTFKPWGTRLGVLAALQYNNVHQTLRETHRIYSVTGNETDGYAIDSTQPTVDYRGVKTTQNVQASALALVKWNFDKNHRLELTSVYTRDADNEARVLQGRARNTCSLTDECRNTRLRYIMRSIVFTRLGGRHVFDGARGLTLDWFGSYAQARQDDPLLRESLFNNDHGTWRVAPNESGKFQFFRLVDNTATGALNLTMPFKQWRGLDGRVKIGGWAETRQRQFLARTIDLEPRGWTGSMPSGTGNIFNKDTIGGGVPMTQGGTEPFVITEVTRPGQDGYRGGQQVYAGYAMLDLPFTRWFRLVGGARFEANNIRVTPYNPFDPNAPPPWRVDIRDRLVLPSGSLIFSPRQDMNIRLAGAETVARPEMRELSQFLFVDFAGGFAVQGNPNLKSTRVWNADARWEWFPSANEVIAASVFYKYFDAPIERVIATSPLLQTFRNAINAQNVGVEVEARKNLGFVSKSMKDFSLGANFAYIYSRVQIPEPVAGDPLNALTNPIRPLEGQSPYVVNAYFSYDSDKSGTNVRLLYNTFGRRIVFVGANHLPDVYEKPIHTLDFALSQRVYKGLNLTFLALNMLNWRQTFVQGAQDSVFYQTRRGVSFILGLNYTF